MSKTFDKKVFHSIFILIFHWTFISTASVDLRCSNFDVTRLSEISYQCGKELTCFFENIHADNETQFVYAADRYVHSYKCIGFVNSTILQLPIDLFKRYPNIEILYGANLGRLIIYIIFARSNSSSNVKMSGYPLGLTSISRSLFETAGKLVDLHLEGNQIAGNVQQHF